LRVSGRLCSASHRRWLSFSDIRFDFDGRSWTDAPELAPSTKDAAATRRRHSGVVQSDLAEIMERELLLPWT